MNKRVSIILLAGFLSACGSNDNPPPAPEIVRTCESIRSDVIRIAATNGVTMVKIYDPKTLKTGPKEISCSGRVLVSSGQSTTLYYRDSQDEDGDWLVQYAEQPLE
ncbi:hypothetical protein HZF05_14590 [Sphingomonas sp. CGMCC 1.13654]|uniref:Lipoprotein n=1 Tax=Sphingomonas chungangi TaxID=2683589 RepID=A0A838L749_9SPHN|nr:hypothetical protein [Sphingomonas chungangi]MBA2935313.1 hypothetical protein [Sphingomonas chungangi]MVW56820.1 hypothetical protein [Sphingomonas chungangi]